MAGRSIGLKDRCFYQTVGAARALGTGGGAEVCRKATEVAGANYINMKEIYTQ